MTYAEVVAHSRPTFPYTRYVSQRLGALVAVAGIARDWRPASVTLASLAVSLLTSAVVLTGVSGLIVAAVATVGWQLAYALDCADGQLSRAAGRTSAAGAALDIYGDAVGRLVMVAVLFESIAARGLALPVGVVAVLAGGALASLFHEAADKIGAIPPREPGPPSVAREMVGLVRDGGVPYLLFGLSLALGPWWTVGALAYAAAMGAAQIAVRFLRLTVAARRA